MSFQWQTTPQEAWGELSDAYVASIRRGVYALAQRYAVLLESEMKSNAIWVDFTGNARQTLYAEVEQIAMDMVEIVVSHGVSYGIYLELAHQGRFAIVNPTIDQFAPQIWADVVAMLR